MIEVAEKLTDKPETQVTAPVRTFTDIKHMWVDKLSEPAFDPNTDSIDVIVETDAGELWAASFVTLPYLKSQMQLGMEHAVSIDMPPVKYATLEDAHLLVEDLRAETIEDTIDCLVERGIFETVFTRYTGAPDQERALKRI